MTNLTELYNAAMKQESELKKALLVAEAKLNKTYNFGKFQINIANRKMHFNKGRDLTTALEQENWHCVVSEEEPMQVRTINTPCLRAFVEGMDERELIIGAFYWVLIALDPDGEDWENEKMPGRFIGYAENGDERFQTIGCEDTEWPVRWIGEQIVLKDKYNSAPNTGWFNKLMETPRVDVPKLTPRILPEPNTSFKFSFGPNDLLRPTVEEMKACADVIKSVLAKPSQPIANNSEPAQRITEQDAREIIDAFCLFTTDKTLPVHLKHWLESSYWGDLLAKLNEHREVTHNKAEVLLHKLRVEVLECINILALCKDKTPIDQLGEKLANAYNNSLPQLKGDDTK